MDTQDVTNQSTNGTTNLKTHEVANQLVHMCREGKNLEAVEELYADNVTSREMPGVPDELIAGKQAVLDKSKEWLDSVEEFHNGIISDPVIAGNHFTCKMDFDVTFKGRGRQQMEEVCVYEVSDGKIVSEQFFYNM